jgi:predicted ATPase/class 3 adenylate cyclase
VLVAPSGTVTFLFTDIEGSTRLWDSVPDAMGVALERHDAILRGAIEAHDGYVFATGGDGFAAAFVTSAAALGAAIDVQRGLTAEPWPAGAAISVRMGVHTGEAAERDGDYFGPALNRAARLMAVAHGGQVVCSQSTAALVGADAKLQSLGEHRLRDLTAAESVFQVGDGVFPPLRSVDAVPTNLPTLRTELIGRSDEVDVLTRLVTAERLVTLTGVGGVGKTRLALGVAAGIAARFSDGCWFVELAPLASGDEVAKGVAAAMRSQAVGEQALVSYLADRRSLLLLDNCEHELDDAAQLVDAVLTAAPDVHVLVTSREPLGIDGEQVRRVQSLAVPGEHVDVAGAGAAAAVRLFVERAAAASEGFTLDTDNVGSVVEICRHLDGIPLAIELAAARVRGMSPAEIARRLDERFRILAGGSRRAQERHRTLFATVSWSHDLLSDDERSTFRRLAVFPASFDLEAAEAVVSGGGVDVVDCVLRPVDRSLVVYEPDLGRYRLLETLRQYGADRLADASETEHTRERHGRYFLGLVDRVGPQLADVRYADAAQSLSAELDNLRATADWCVEVGQWAELASLCSHLWMFLSESAPVDGAAWHQQLIEHEAVLDSQVAIDALGDYAWIHVMNLGNYTAGIALAERSLALAESGDLEASPAALGSLSQAAIYTGTMADVVPRAERAFAVADARRNEGIAVAALSQQVAALAALGHHERSAAIAEQALRRAERAGNPVHVSSALITAAGAYLWMSTEPDFTASVTILETHHLELTPGDLNAMWLDNLWGMTLLGLHRPGAVQRLASAAFAADRLNAPHALDLALRQLAIAASRAGRLDLTAKLVAYSDTHLAAHHIDTPGRAWVQELLDNALATEEPIREPQSLRRAEIMTLVTDLQDAFARTERGEPARPEPAPADGDITQRQPSS